jgi:RNA polymerase sigma factor (sigma-70 family)
MENETELRFLQAYEKNKNSLYRVCKGYFKDKEDAKDIFQEVLLQLWKGFPKFRGEASEHTWMYRVALNVCLRQVYTAGKKRKRHLSLESVRVPAQEGEPFFRNEEHRQLYECIHRLEDLERSVVLLHLEELSHREIAEVTGLTENHVAVKLKRIKGKLFNCLTKYT